MEFLYPAELSTQRTTDGHLEVQLPSVGLQTKSWPRMTLQQPRESRNGMWEYGIKEKAASGTLQKYNKV